MKLACHKIDVDHNLEHDSIRVHITFDVYGGYGNSGQGFQQFFEFLMHQHEVNSDILMAWAQMLFEIEVSEKSGPAFSNKLTTSVDLAYEHLMKLKQDFYMKTAPPKKEMTTEHYFSNDFVKELLTPKKLKKHT